MSLQKTKSAYVRALANTIIDAGVHPTDNVKVILAFIRAGWPAKIIEECGDAAVMMALIRQYNSERRGQEILSSIGGN